MSAISAIATSVPPGDRNPAGNHIRLRSGLKLWRHRKGRHTAVALAWGMLGAASAVAAAQDMMRHVDLTSPEMTTAEMTRADVVASIAAARPASVDFTGKKLSGLDLSGLDLSGAVLRAAKLNKTNLAGAKLDRAILDQVGCWRPISVTQVSRAPTCLLRKCSAQGSTQPIFRARA